MTPKHYITSAGIAGAAALAAAVAVMPFVTPVDLGPLGVTGWFLLVMFGLVATLSWIIYGVEARLAPKRPQSLRVRESARRGVLLGGYATVVVGLSSLRQLNLRDVLLLALLLVLVEFYVVARA